MDASAGLTLLTRLGFAARGLLYLVIAYLLIRVGRAESPSGALAYLAEGGGKALMIAMIAGLAAYGVWRLADALLNVERHPASNKGVRERLGAGGSGLIHLFLAWQAFRLLQGAGSASSDGSQSTIRDALSMPGGGMILVAAGAVLSGVGAFQVMKGYKCNFLRHLDPRAANEPWAKWLGRAGYSARGIIFMISGYFAVRAGLQEQASEAGGMDEALTWLPEPWGMIVAAGLFGFGLYSLIEARYRVLHGVSSPDQMRF